MPKIDLSVGNKNVVVEALVKHLNEILSSYGIAVMHNSRTGSVERITIHDFTERNQLYSLFLDGVNMRLSNGTCTVLEADLNDPTSIDELDKFLLTLYKPPQKQPEFCFRRDS